jgi:hypothetical protein
MENIHSAREWGLGAADRYDRLMRGRSPPSRPYRCALDPMRSRGFPASAFIRCVWAVYSFLLSNVSAVPGILWCIAWRPTARLKSLAWSMIACC